MKWINPLKTKKIFSPFGRGRGQNGGGVKPEPKLQNIS